MRIIRLKSAKDMLKTDEDMWIAIDPKDHPLMRHMFGINVVLRDRISEEILKAHDIKLEFVDDSR